MDSESFMPWSKGKKSLEELSKSYLSKNVWHIYFKYTTCVLHGISSIFLYAIIFFPNVLAARKPNLLEKFGCHPPRQFHKKSC